MRTAQQLVINEMKRYKHEIPSRSGMIEINNAAARQYVTMLENNVWMHFVAWQKKFVF